MKPRSLSKETPRWLYEALRGLETDIGDVKQQFTALTRGEAPYSGGHPLGMVQYHSQLLGLDKDDHKQYAYLPGRAGGQVLNGSPLSSSALAWNNAGDFTTKNQKASVSSWTPIAIDVSASIGDVIILNLSTGPFGTSLNGATSFHTTISDSKGNTWIKIAEYSFSDTFLNGLTTSVWYCIVTTGLTSGVDTLTANFSATIGKMTISSHRFTLPAGATSISAEATAFLGEQNFTGNGPSSLTLSGLNSQVNYLWIRTASIGNAGSLSVAGFTPSTNYTSFQTSNAATGGATDNVASYTQYRVYTAAVDSTDPASGGAGGGYFVSIYLALTAISSNPGLLELRSFASESAGLINLNNYLVDIKGTNIRFFNAGGSSVLSYIRGSDGTFVGLKHLGNNATSDPGAGQYLNLLGFDNAPIAGTSLITNRSAEINISRNIIAYCASLQVVERSTDYSTAAGFQVDTGLGFANATLWGGTLSLKPNTAGGSPQLLIDNSLTGSSLSAILGIIKKKASQTGDMLEFQDSTSAVMSYVRASDGAFVGPVVASGTDTHLDGTFRLLNTADNTKVAAFDCSGISTATTRTYTFLDVSASFVMTSSVNGQRIGTASATGNTDDIASSGRIGLGPNFTTYGANSYLNIQANFDNNFGLVGLIRAVPTITATLAGTFRIFSTSMSGGSSITTGNILAEGGNFTISPSFTGGATNVSARGLFLSIAGSAAATAIIYDGLKSSISTVFTPVTSLNLSGFNAAITGATTGGTCTVSGLLLSIGHALSNPVSANMSCANMSFTGQITGGGAATVSGFIGTISPTLSSSSSGIVTGVNLTVSPTITGIATATISGLTLIVKQNNIAPINSIQGASYNPQGVNSFIGDSYNLLNMTGSIIKLSPYNSNINFIYGLYLTGDGILPQGGVVDSLDAICFDNLAVTGQFSSQTQTCTGSGGNPTLSSVQAPGNVKTGMYVTGTNIPPGTYVNSVNVGASTVTLNNNCSGAVTSVQFWGTITQLSFIHDSTPIPTGVVRNATFIDQQIATLPSQHAGKFYFNPPTPANYPLPTAWIHIGAGSAAAGTAPLKLTAGVNLTVPEAGAIEFDGTSLFVTDATPTRKTVFLTDGTNAAAANVGTLNNAPAVGDPVRWLPIVVGGVTYRVPVW